MKITCPACKPVGKIILSFFTDIKYFFSKDFIKDFTKFVKDYSIDIDGQVKLSNLIRRAK